MAKQPIKKAAPKKSVKKVSTKKVATKKSPAKKTATKKTVTKKVPNEKDLLLKEANRIENSEKKKKSTRRPTKVTTKAQATSLLDAIIEGMEEKKGKNITVIDLQKLDNRVCDYFVICDAESSTHVSAIADSVEDIVGKKTIEKPYHSEGFENAEWILIDYINIVVHVFQRHIREYYNIEGLWADGELTTID